MSSGSRMQWSDAKKKADHIVNILRPYVERIEIAGSIRRRSATVGDIEIVAVPHVQKSVDLFGNTAEVKSLFGKDLIKNLFPTANILLNGPRQKKFVVDGTTVDFFLVWPPAHFGVMFAIRTGSAEFSHMLVTKKRYGGWLPNHFRIKNGRLQIGDGELAEIIPTPNEDDFFHAIGFKTPLPEYRGLKKKYKHSEILIPPEMLDA